MLMILYLKKKGSKINDVNANEHNKRKPFNFIPFISNVTVNAVNNNHKNIRKAN